MASLAPTFGRGAMTNSWTDIANTDLVVVMGGNAAEAHPCGFKWVMEARSRRKAKLIVVDPRLTRTAAVADLYVPIRPGTDIAWLGGLITYLIEHDKIHRDYVLSFTNAPYLIRRGSGSRTGSSPATTRRSASTTWRAGATSSTQTGASKPTRNCRTGAASSS